MPEGATSVLIKEDSDLEGDRLEAREALQENAHIRRKGFDFDTGDVILAAGRRIAPAQLALLIAAGCKMIDVRKMPRVAILECGDELNADATHLGQVPPSNGAMLAAMCASETCSTTLPPPLPDDLPAIAAAIDEAREADMVVISGGASVGDHDLVRPALKSLGIDIDFWRVAMKPGKPLMVARRGRQVILGLPGNPVSSFVTSFLFMLPAIRILLGASQAAPVRWTLPVATDLPPVGMRREFLRAASTGKGVAPVSEQDSSALLALSQADCLIERPEHAGEVKAGTSVPVYPFGNGGFA